MIPKRMLGTEDGTMRRRMTHDAIPGMLLVLVAMLAGCGSSGGREGAIGTAGTSAVVVQKGDPVLPAAPGYAGSRTCADCHPNQFEGWGKSLHNAPLKTVAELGDRIFVNDVDGNGVNDFQRREVSRDDRRRYVRGPEDAGRKRLLETAVPYPDRQKLLHPAVPVQRKDRGVCPVQCFPLV
jgi:hypothetical protein